MSASKMEDEGPKRSLKHGEKDNAVPDAVASSHERASALWNLEKLEQERTRLMKEISQLLVKEKQTYIPPHRRLNNRFSSYQDYDESFKKNYSKTSRWGFTPSGSWDEKVSKE